MSLSVVIVNYNAGPMLSACVGSILRSPLDVEVIVVDNASEDDSIGLVEHSGDGRGKLTIIRNETNRGFAAACNEGALRAGGSYILYLNPDCILEDQALESLLEVLSSGDRVGMVGGLLLNPDGTEQAGGRRSVPTPGRALLRMLGLHRFVSLRGVAYDLHKTPLPKTPVEVDAVSGACMLVRREALDEVGGLDEGYFMHCEDLDWCMRFRSSGWSIVFVPTAKVIHAKGTCSKSRRMFVEWHKHKGMVRFYRRFFSARYPAVLSWVVPFGVWSRFGGIVLVHSARTMRAWLSGRYE